MSSTDKPGILHKACKNATEEKFDHLNSQKDDSYRAFSLDVIAAILVFPYQKILIKILFNTRVISAKINY